MLAGAGVAQRLDDMLDGAQAGGGTGMAQDAAGYTLAPWGFDPARLAVVAEVGHLAVVPFWGRAPAHPSSGGRAVRR